MYWELGCACVLTHWLVAVVVLRWFSQRRRKLIGQRPSNLPRSLLLAGKSFVMNVVLGISGLVTQPVRGEWPPCLSVMSVVLTSPASSSSLSVVSDPPVSLWWVSSSHLRPRHPACPWWVTPLSLCDECRPHISGLVTQPVRGEWPPCLSVMSVVLRPRHPACPWWVTPLSLCDECRPQASSPSLSVVSDPPVSLWWVSSSHLRPRHPACPWWVTPLSLCDECRPQASSPSLSVVSDPPVSLWWVSSSHLRPRHPACPWWVTPLSLCDECRPHISGLVIQPVRGEWPPCLCDECRPHISGLVTQPVRGEWRPRLSVMSVVLTSPASSPSLSVVSDPPVSLWWVSSSHLRPRHPACPWWVTPLSLCDECRPHISGLVTQPVRGEWPPCLSVMSVVLTSPASSPSLSVVSDPPVSLWWVSSSHLRPRHPACPWWVTPLSLCDECRPHISGLVTQPVRGEWPPCLSVMSVVLTSQASSPSLSVVSDPPVSLWWVSSSHLRPRHPACPWWVTPLSLCDECRPHISGLVTQPVRGEWPLEVTVFDKYYHILLFGASLSVYTWTQVNLSPSHFRCSDRGSRRILQGHWQGLAGTADEANWGNYRHAEYGIRRNTAVSYWQYKTITTQRVVNLHNGHWMFWGVQCAMPILICLCTIVYDTGKCIF